MKITHQSLFVNLIYLLEIPLLIPSIILTTEQTSSTDFTESGLFVISVDSSTDPRIGGLPEALSKALLC